MLSMNKFLILALVASIIVSVVQAGEKEEKPAGGLGSKLMAGAKSVGGKVMSKVGSAITGNKGADKKEAAGADDKKAEAA